MNTPPAAAKRVDPNVVPSPYPGRHELLPRTRDKVNAEWLSRTLQNRYPGAVAESFELVQLFDSHTTKMRITVRWNDQARAAGLPEHLCLKSNWSGMFQ